MHKYEPEVIKKSIPEFDSEIISDLGKDRDVNIHKRVIIGYWRLSNLQPQQ
jgi:hypothetical protein